MGRIRRRSNHTLLGQSRFAFSLLKQFYNTIQINKVILYLNFTPQVEIQLNFNLLKFRTELKF